MSGDPTNDADTPTHVLASRTFSIPFRVATRDAASRVELLVTEGGGVTVGDDAGGDRGFSGGFSGGIPWRTAATLSATGARAFSYTAAGDGEYWFTTRTIGGGASPSAAGEDILRVRVDTTPPEIALDVDADGDGVVEARWEVVDATRTDEPVVRYATDQMKAWEIVPSGATDRVRFTPAGDWDQIAVHVSIRDAAGNNGGEQRIVRRPRVAVAPLRRLAAAPGRSRYDGFGGYAPPADADPTGRPSAASPDDASRRWGGVGLPASAAGAIATMRRSGTAGRMVSDAPVAVSAGPPESSPTAETSPTPATPRPGGPSRPYELVPPPAARRPATSDGTDERSTPTPGQRRPVDGRSSANDGPSLTFNDDLINATPNGSEESAETVPTPDASRRSGGVRSPVDSPSEAFRPIVRTDPPPTSVSAEPPDRSPGDVPPERNGSVDRRGRSVEASALFDRVPRRFSDSRRFSLDYEVELISARGVEAIELYGSTDRGATWSLWGRDPDRTSPFDIETRESGTFGYRIVVVGSGGLASPRPLAGDEPDIVVVVDETPPKVRFRSVAYGDGDEAGSLIVEFDAIDENFDERPLTLSIGETPDGPWTTIGGGLRNNGRYAWPANPSLPRAFYLRLDATDQAGNVTTRVLDEPVDAQGLAPRARIRGFRSL